MTKRLILALVLGLFLAGVNCAAHAQAISALSAATTLGGTELIPCDQSSVTVYCTPTQISTFVRAGPTTTLGAADAASPTAQTLNVQSVVAGTSNTAGVNFTVAASQGTGTGAGGSIIFQVAAAGGSGSSKNAEAATLTLSAANNKLATFAGPVQVPVTVVGSLPSCSATYQGAHMFVTDSNSTTFHATAAGSGSNKVSVVCDGTNWYVGG